MESLGFFAYEFSIFGQMLFRNLIQDYVHAFLRYIGVFYDSIHDIAHQRYNLCLLLLKNGRYTETITRINELIPAAKEAGSYRHLCVCYLRKGFALAKTGNLEGQLLIDQAFRLIEAADDQAFKANLENEYNLLEEAASS